MDASTVEKILNWKVKKFSLLKEKTGGVSGRIEQRCRPQLKDSAYWRARLLSLKAGISPKEAQPAF